MAKTDIMHVQSSLEKLRILPDNARLRKYMAGTQTLRYSLLVALSEKTGDHLSSTRLLHDNFGQEIQVVNGDHDKRLALVVAEF